MERKEVIAKFREEVRPVVLTWVIDTGEFYVAFVCTRSGRCAYEAQYSMSYDGKMGAFKHWSLKFTKRLKMGLSFMKITASSKPARAFS